MKKFSILFVALGALLLAGCSTASPGPDEQGLHYKGGSFSSKKFADCLKPSKRVYNGPGDEHVLYPAGQRTFSFTGRKGAESKAVSVKTQDNQQVAVKGFITFKLTEDCDKLREFHENIGSKYRAYTVSGWREFLGDYLGVPLNSTMDKAGLQFPWQTLYSSNEALTDFETKVKDALPGEVKAALGDDYIKIVAVNLETPEPSKALLEGLEAAESAKLANKAQKERNETARTAYDSFKDCKKVLSESSCLTLRLAENNDITIYPIPSGSAVNIPGSK